MRVCCRAANPLSPNAFVRIGWKMAVSQPVGPNLLDGLQTTLDRLGLGEFYGLLSANRVSVDQIAELTEADLRELGLTPEQRRRFLRAPIAPVGIAPAGQGPHRLLGAAVRGERRDVAALMCVSMASTTL